MVPGPGNYNPKMELDGKGTYSLARYRNSGAPIFTKAGRDTTLDTSVTRKSKLLTDYAIVVLFEQYHNNLFNIVTPGPGTYRF